MQLSRPPDDDPTAGNHDTVDEWGRDARLIELLSPLARLRWNVEMSGLHHLPDREGALLVTNQRHLSMSPLYVSWALAGATGRPVRFAGRPDSAPLGAALRRVGGLLSHPEEVRGALRHGELVVVGARPTGHPRHAGAIDADLVGAAILAGVAVVPVASMSSMFGRAARVEVGAPILEGRQRRGALAEVEVAAAAQRRLQHMLDALGTHGGTASLDWLEEG